MVMDDDRFDRDGQLSDELAMQTTERIAPASKLYQLAKLTVFLVPLVTTTSSSVVDVVLTATAIGVVTDDPPTMSSHFLSVCRSGICQLRQLQSICRS